MAENNGNQTIDNLDGVPEMEETNNEVTVNTEPTVVTQPEEIKTAENDQLNKKVEENIPNPVVNEEPAAEQKPETVDQTKIKPAQPTVNTVKNRLFPDLGPISMQMPNNPRGNLSSPTVSSERKIPGMDFIQKKEPAKTEEKQSAPKPKEQQKPISAPMKIPGMGASYNNGVANNNARQLTEEERLTQRLNAQKTYLNALRKGIANSPTEVRQRLDEIQRVEEDIKGLNKRLGLKEEEKEKVSFLSDEQIKEAEAKRLQEQKEELRKLEKHLASLMKVLNTGSEEIRLGNELEKKNLEKSIATLKAFVPESERLPINDDEEQNTVDDPAVEEPEVNDPAVEEPTVEEPAVTEPEKIEEKAANPTVKNPVKPKEKETKKFEYKYLDVQQELYDENVISEAEIEDELDDDITYSIDDIKVADSVETHKVTMPMYKDLLEQRTNTQAITDRAFGRISSILKSAGKEQPSDSALVSDTYNKLLATIKDAGTEASMHDLATRVFSDSYDMLGKEGLSQEDRVVAAQNIADMMLDTYSPIAFTDGKLNKYAKNYVTGNSDLLKQQLVQKEKFSEEELSSLMEKVNTTLVGKIDFKVSEIDLEENLEENTKENPFVDYSNEKFEEPFETARNDTKLTEKVRREITKILRDPQHLDGADLEIKVDTVMECIDRIPGMYAISGDIGKKTPMGDYAYDMFDDILSDIFIDEWDLETKFVKAQKVANVILQSYPPISLDPEKHARYANNYVLNSDSRLKYAVAIYAADDENKSYLHMESIRRALKRAEEIKEEPEEIELRDIPDPVPNENDEEKENKVEEPEQDVKDFNQWLEDRIDNPDVQKSVKAELTDIVTETGIQDNEQINDIVEITQYYVAKTISVNPNLNGDAPDMHEIAVQFFDDCYTGIIGVEMSQKNRVIAAQKLADVMLKNYSPVAFAKEKYGKYADNYVLKNRTLLKERLEKFDVRDVDTLYREANRAIANAPKKEQVQPIAEKNEPNVENNVKKTEPKPLYNNAFDDDAFMSNAEDSFEKKLAEKQKAEAEKAANNTKKTEQNPQQQPKPTDPPKTQQQPAKPTDADDDANEEEEVLSEEEKRRQEIRMRREYEQIKASQPKPKTNQKSNDKLPKLEFKIDNTKNLAQVLAENDEEEVNEFIPGFTPTVVKKKEEQKKAAEKTGAKKPETKKAEPNKAENAANATVFTNKLQTFNQMYKTDVNADKFVGRVSDAWELMKSGDAAKVKEGKKALGDLFKDTLKKAFDAEKTASYKEHRLPEYAEVVKSSNELLRASMFAFTDLYHNLKSASLFKETGFGGLNAKDMAELTKGDSDWNKDQRSYEAWEIQSSDAKKIAKDWLEYEKPFEKMISEMNALAEANKNSIVDRKVMLDKLAAAEWMLMNDDKMMIDNPEDPLNKMPNWANRYWKTLTQTREALGIPKHISMRELIQGDYAARAQAVTNSKYNENQIQDYVLDPEVRGMYDSLEDQKKEFAIQSAAVILGDTKKDNKPELTSDDIKVRISVESENEMEKWRNAPKENNFLVDKTPQKEKGINKI